MKELNMKSPRLFPRRRRQRGQAILWFLAMTAACCAALALVFNVGQVANEKEKTVNAADATALAGAMVEARMLNFDSYCNRAIIADEVNVAQLISLDSWYQYLNQFSQNLRTAFGWVPEVGNILQSLATAMMEGGEDLDAFVQAMITADQTAVTGMLEAQQYAVRSTAVPAARDIANKIATANQASVVTAVEATAFALNLQAWLDFTKVYGKDDNGRDDRSTVAGVILASRDQFSTHRDGGAVIDAINLALGGPFAPTGVQKTSGDTILPTENGLTNYDRWEAQDSLDMWVGLQLFGQTIFKTYLPLPLAWGRRDADQQGVLGANWDGTSHCPLPGTPNCEYAYRAGRAWSGWSGMPQITNLTNPGNANNDPSLTYVVGVTKAAPTTTQQLGMNVPVTGPQGSPDLKDNLRNNQLASISAARVSFMRPDWNTNDKTEGHLPNQYKVHEYASLYNPYWQARLTNPDSVKLDGVSATSLLYTAIGQPGLNCVMNPTSCL